MHLIVARVFGLIIAKGIPIFKGLLMKTTRERALRREVFSLRDRLAWLFSPRDEFLGKQATRLHCADRLAYSPGNLIKIKKELGICKTKSCTEY